MNSKFIVLTIGLVALIALTVFLAPTASAKVAGIVVIADLSHGQGSLGLDILMKVVPEAEWYILVDSSEAAAALDPAICNLARGILVGSFDSMTLYPSCEAAATGTGGVSISLGALYADMVIIGQHSSILSDDEITAIKNWMSKRPGVALWIAGDSDYGTGKLVQEVINSELEALDSVLRLELVSVEDSVNNCGGRGYRVVAFVDPPDELWFIRLGAEKVLAHGPGVVAGFDVATGNFVPIRDREMTISGRKVVTLLRTSTNGEIVENTEDDRPIEIKAYKVGEKGSFPIVAAEIRETGTILIASGESPYGAYQPMVTFRYYEQKLDGPRFLRNVILWATGYMGELEYIISLKKVITSIEEAAKKDLEKLAGELRGIGSEVEGLSTDVSELRDKLTKLSDTVTGLSTSISSLDSRVGGVEGKISDIESKVTDLESSVKSVEGSIGALSTNQTISIALGVVALILAIAAIALAIRRK
ncbi:MAG: hypothetical protein DRO15_02070 [Thermoprotei archaeon]|nr:MAG: hypothetical protein DRO15_02070 [Thermoprotei archaeon]